MELNQNDKQWILEARKDLKVSQIANILSSTLKKKVTPKDIVVFLKSISDKNSNKPIAFIENEYIDQPLTKDFIKDQIRAGVTQKVLAIRLGLEKDVKLYLLLKEKLLSWNDLKKEVFKENENNLGKLKCTRCNNVKNNTEFYLNKKTITGFSCWCKQCHKDYDKETRAKRKKGLKKFERRK